MERGTFYSFVGSQNNQVIRASPFSLVYGTESIIPIDLVKPVVKIVEIAGIPREDLLEIVEEKRDNATSHNPLY